MHRNNLIVEGLPEVEKEDYKESQKIAISSLPTLNLKPARLTCPSCKLTVTSFRVTHYIKFLNFKSKTQVWENARKLKDIKPPKVWLEDGNPVDAEKNFLEFAKGSCAWNEHFQVRFYSLHIRGRIFPYNAATGSVFQVSTGRELPIKWQQIWVENKPLTSYGLYTVANVDALEACTAFTHVMNPLT